MRKKTFKPIAMLLVMVMALSTGIVASAAEEHAYQIDIRPNRYINQPTKETDDQSDLATRFWAYQIFTGTINAGSTGNGEDAGTGTYGAMGQGNLGYVTWGSGIDSDEYGDLLKALVNDSTPLTDIGITAADGYDGCTTMGGLFAKGLERAGYTLSGSAGQYTGVSGSTSDGDLSKSAMAIARVLMDFVTEDNNNPALAEALGKAVSGYLSVPEATSTWSNGMWHIGDRTKDAGQPLEGGYYLIKDVNGNGTGFKDKANSDLIMGVFGNTAVYAKSDAPGLIKELTGTGRGFSTGEPIGFRLIGTLPANFANYGSYAYSFHDTFDAGLSYAEGSLKVEAKVANPLHTGENSEPETFTVDITGITGITVDQEGQELTVLFSDLRSQGFANGLNGKFHEQFTASAYTDTNVKITADSEVCVSYDLYLNASAGMSSLKGNQNRAYLEYSNDPADPDASSTTEETTEKKESVYTFGIQFRKYDGMTDGNDPLAGAGFVLAKEVSGTKYYAVMSDRTSGPDGATAKVLVGWIREGDLSGAIGSSGSGVSSGDRAISPAEWRAVRAGVAGDAIKDSGVAGSKLFNESSSYSVVMESPSNGIIRIDGLKDGTYELKEVYAPTGYDPIDAISVALSAAYYASDEGGHVAGDIKSLSITVDDGSSPVPYQVIADGTWAESHTDMSAAFEVGNYFVMRAPGTGGMGVYLIYGTGGLLAAVSITALIIMKRKKAE